MRESRNPGRVMSRVAVPQTSKLVPSPLLPDGFKVPASRFIHPSTRMRELLEAEPFLFGPGVYDPMGAQLVMYYGFKAVYFSGYSFAIGHLGTTDMDLYSNVAIAGPASPSRERAAQVPADDGGRRAREGDPAKASRYPAGDRRHGRRLRQHLQRPAHPRALRDRGRGSGAHRRPGAPQALRSHRRQSPDPGQRDGRQAADGAGGRRRLRQPR